MVGIDEYRAPVPALRGCVADVERVGRLLERRAAAAGDAFELMTLTNGAATRRAVIEAFRSHLATAGPQDTALFYYSGHGSQERALPQHLTARPDGVNETIVLVDSRDDGTRDLADIELAQLVGEVSAHAGHTLVVLDCCHSGSELRSLDERRTRVRRAPEDERTRSAESYLVGGSRAGTSTVGALSIGRSSGNGPGGDASEVPADLLNPDSGSYVLVAACRSDQTAKEVRIDGADRGAFSAALETALAVIGGQPTYLELQRWVSAALRTLVADQSPVLEAPTPSDARKPFLGGIAAPDEPLLTAAFVPQRGWVLDAGRMHGLAPGTPDAPATVALHRLGSIGGSVGGSVTTALVLGIAATSSMLEPVDPAALDRGETYRAVVISLGQPQAVVAVLGTGANAQAVRAALADSAVVGLAAGDDGDVVVDCTGPVIQINRSGADRPLAAEGDANDADAVDRIALVCEHIGRWVGLANRRNPTSRLRTEQVTLDVFDRAGDPIASTDGVLEVVYTGPDDEDGPIISVEYANRSQVPLHCAVLVLTETYGIECLTVGGSVVLDRGASARVTDEDGRPRLRTFVTRGRDRTTDLLKLLVSTEPFDAQSMTQEELAPPAPGQGLSRGISRRSQVPAAGQDWTTREVLVTTVRPHR